MLLTKFTEQLVKFYGYECTDEIRKFVIIPHELDILALAAKTEIPSPLPVYGKHLRINHLKSTFPINLSLQSILFNVAVFMIYCFELMGKHCISLFRYVFLESAVEHNS